MKKFFCSLGVIAALAFAFSACQKEQSIKDEQLSDKLVTVTFTAEKAGDETRTAAVVGETSVSYVWTAEDVANIKLFEVGEDSNGKEELTVVANPAITKVSDTQLTISASVAPGNHVFRAVLSGTWTNDGKKPRVSASQTPKSDNFDPNADVLVSDDMEVKLVDSGEETISTGARMMVFRRPVVVNKMTLKNLTAGETIDNVVITSDKNLTGYFNYNPTAASGDGKIITLSFNNEITVPENENGEVPVFFTTVPGTEQSLTIEVTTNQKVYTKSFAAGKTIDFVKGEFTVFGVAFPAGVSRTSLVLPVEDDMAWAMTGASDLTAEMTAADLIATQGDKKIYDSATKVYKGGDGMKFGNSKEVGSITTKEIDLSSEFYIAINAKAYGSDASKLFINVDGTNVYTSSTDLATDFETYYVNCAAANADSKITIGMTKRGYINHLVIGSGTYVASPKINVTSNNPMEVSNGNDLYTIEYMVSNPVEGATISAEANVDWIHAFDYSTAGEVSFVVDAQAAGAASRDGIITLSYAGANDVEVTISQAAGAGGSTTFAYLFTSKTWTATLNNEAANWTSGKAGYGFDDARGIQVTKSVTGANATSPVSFNTISNITVSLAKTSSGTGNVQIMVGDQTVATQTSFTTSATDYSFDVNELSGKITIVVNCTNNSIYVKGISITANSISGDGGEGDEGTDVTFEVGQDSSESTILEKDGVSLSTTSGVWNRTDNYRIYSGATLTVSAASNKHITGIVFTYAQNKFSTTTGSLTDEGVWTGNAESIEFSTVGGQVRVTKIVVTYK